MQNKKNIDCNDCTTDIHLFDQSLVLHRKTTLETLAGVRVVFSTSFTGQPLVGGCSSFYLKYTTQWAVCKGLILMDNLLPVVQNIVSYAIPIITCATVIIGGVWALQKYFKEKNREFYLEVLAKVYEPLFTELVKMEYGRKLLEGPVIK